MNGDSMNEVTPASLRAHADWIDGCGHGLGPGEALRDEAARLEAEKARDAEVERYAKVMTAAMDPGSEWSLWPAGVVQRWKIAARAVLDALAADGRLLPEGGTEPAPLVHNHGPTSGRGLDCPERVVDGRLRGVCMDEPVADGSPERPWQTWDAVPDGVRYQSQGRSFEFVNRDGVRLSVINGRISRACILRHKAVNSIAPFVRVDGGQA